MEEDEAGRGWPLPQEVVAHACNQPSSGEVKAGGSD